MRTCRVVLTALLLPVAVEAQPASDAEPIPESRPTSDARPSAGVFGRAPAQPVATGAMILAVHPFIDTSRYPLISRNQDGMYVRIGQLFFATFRNSYGDRSFVGAVERHWGSISHGLLDLGVGYRVGIVTGYDERLVSLARHTPVLPLGGVVGWLHVGPSGVNVYWAYRAISLEASLRCC